MQTWRNLLRGIVKYSKISLTVRHTKAYPLLKFHENPSTTLSIIQLTHAEKDRRANCDDHAISCVHARGLDVADGRRNTTSWRRSEYIKFCHDCEPCKKRLNWSRWPLGWGLGWLNKPCIRWRSRSPMWSGNFEGERVGSLQSIGTLCHDLCQNGLTDWDAVWGKGLGEPKEACVRWGAHWRNLTNTTESSMCGGDATFLTFVKQFFPLV